MSAPKPPREVLKDLLDFLDHECDVCIPPRVAIDQKHKARWEKIVRDAHESLKTSLS